MWTNKQQLAIDIQDKNILVAASAGSGKTAVVIERVIEKVINYKIDIDKILVVTFTNAAAQELKERLYKAFNDKLSKDYKNQFLKRQIKLLSRASITTLDSFCIELVRSNFNVLGIDPNFKICDNSKSEILKDKAMKKILESKYKEENSGKKVGNEISLGLYKILELFGGKEENLVSTLLRIYSYIQSFPYPFLYLKESISKYNFENIQNIDLSSTDFGKIIIEDAVSNLNVLLVRTQKLRDEVSGNSEFVRHIELLDEDILTLKRCINESHSWDSLYNVLNTSAFGKNLLVKVSNTALKDKIKDYRANVLKKSFANIQNSIYEKSEEILKDNKKAYEYLEYLYNFLLLFDEQFKKEKRSANLLEFNDIHHLALELLYNKDENNEIKLTDIAKNLEQKYVEVYTDEYQDTDFVQEKILEAVSNGKNRFMVGDIKQSIYKFRQARPEIFNDKYDNYLLVENKENLTESDNIKIVLDDNFRSRKNVIDSINYIFSRIMSKKMGECSYTNIETLKYGANWYRDFENQSYNTEINIIDINNKENKVVYEESEDELIKEIFELQKFEKEAIFIAKRIEKLMREFKVYDSKQDTFRNIKYSDIVILTKALKNKGNVIESTLKKFHIPAFCDLSTNLFLSEEVMLVMSFLRVIDNPLCNIDMLSIMYSIIGKFSLDEIASIKLYKDNKINSVYDSLILYKNDLEMAKNIDNITDKEVLLLEKITNFLAIIEKFRNYSRIYNISDILIKMYKETNIYYQFYLEKMSETKIANLNLLVDIARDYEKNTSYTLNSYISYIDNLKNMENSNGEAKVIGENEDVVRIMTIHKSKGLEFPVVILCDTTSEYNERDLSNTVVMHQDLGIGINIVNEDYDITYPSVIKQAIKNISKREYRSEALRVLYVALTRAKEKLIVFASMENYDKFNQKQFVIYNDDGTVEPMVVEQNSSYFSNINMALKNLPDDDSIFDINKIKLDISNLNEQVNILDDSTNLKKELSINEKINIIKEKFNIDNFEEISDTLKENLNYKYKYESDVNTSSRVSVSSLKEEYMKNNESDIKCSPLIKESGEDETLSDSIFNRKYSLPATLFDKRRNYTPLRKGTLVHFILEILDFDKITSKESLKDFIDKLVVDKVISDEDAKYISIDKIYNFITSDIGKEIKIAKFVKREEEFVLRNTKYSESIIQGIIDLYYVDDKNNAYLVDFKTDKSLDENYYIKRYKLQLDIYKEAIENLTGYNVLKKYIYSFELGKKIEI